jgi:excisionase family DNA binding protein
MTHGDRHALDHGPPGDPVDYGPLLDRHEAAEFLGVSSSTVYRLLRKGDLRAYRVGHQIRLTQTDIENYLKAFPPPTEQED